tara:strand:+ start:213 stop:380 length:168 start_codon:yes stop_codon:yes gene_type:complete
MMKAMDIAEGLEEPKDEKEFIKAWQFLIDTKLAWNLQGAYGRFAKDLIERGICHG